MKQIVKSSLIAGVLGLAVVTTALPAPSAYAQSTTDLQAQIASLLAQIQKLQLQLNNQTGSSVSISLSRNLSQGMTGSDVQQLQQFLNSDPDTLVSVAGAGSKGNETTYFGPATRAAVIKFQNKYRNEILTPVGLTQGTGFVGASTRAKINQMGTVTPGDDNDDSDDADDATDDEGPTVSEEGEIVVTRGNEHTSTLEITGGFEEIYALDIKAEDSDMTINRIDFIFDKRPWLYLDSFVLYLGDDEIAEVKATENNFSKVNNEYRLRFSNLAAKIDKGDEDTIILEAKALKSISSTRQSDNMSVYVPQNGVRATDTAKITSQEPNSNLAARTFDFRDAENDGEINVSLNTDSPESGVIQVKERTNTTNSTVMIANVKAEDSDLDVKEIYVKVDSSESNVTNVVRNLSLVFDGNTIAREDVNKNGSSPITGTDEDGNTYTIIGANEYYVHFDDLEGIEIDEDDKEQLTFKAEFYKQSGKYANGTEVTFTLRSIEGENVNGEDVVNGDLNTGENRTFSLYTDGLSFKMVSEDAETQGQMNRSGVFTLEFDVTAFGDDIYVPTSVDRQISSSTLGTVGAEYRIANGSGELYALGSAFDSMDIKGATKSSGYFKLNEGSTYRVTIEILLDNAGATTNFYQAELEAFRFKVGSTSGTEHSIVTGFNDFETDAISINS